MNKNLSEQNDWDELPGFISDRQLTPIIGKEMYKVTGNNTLMPIDEYLSRQILELSHVTDRPALPLTKAVDYLENEKKIKQMAVTKKLKSIDKIKWNHFVLF